MKWFERHLNWTAILTTIISFGFVILTYVICYGFTIVYFPEGTPVEIHIYVGIVLFLTMLIGTIGMLWIITRKRLSLWILLPFLITLLLQPCVYLFQLYEWWKFPDYGSNYLFLGFIFLLSVPVWIIGLIIVLILRQNRKIGRYSKVFAFSKYFRPSPQQIFTALFRISLVLLILITGFSCFRMNYATKSITQYSYDFREPAQFNYISFDIPYSFRGGWGHWTWSEPLFWYWEDNIFSDTDIKISIEPLDTESTIPITEYIYDYYDISAGTDNIDVETILVDGIIAEYSTFQADIVDLFFTTRIMFVRLVRFERNGAIWTIAFSEQNSTKSNYAFNTLIETFEISG